MKVLSTEGLTKLIDLIKSSFISNEDTQATVAVDAVETGTVDESSLTVGSVINQRDNTTAIKTWTGTLAQYNAIATKDSNTLYNITDDNTAVAYQAYTKSETDTAISNAISDILNLMYPVGSIYICTNSVCPLGALINGSVWSLVARNRVLQGVNATSEAGTTKEAGLPNINGSMRIVNDYNFDNSGINNAVNGAFSVRTFPAVMGANIQQNTTPSGDGIWDVNFNASRSSSIYGNSNTVQPPAYLVNIWERVL